MNEFTTKKGTKVYVALENDCEENEGGFFVEIYLCGHDIDEGYYDYFVIHPDEVDCTNEEEVDGYIKWYIGEIDEY